MNFAHRLIIIGGKLVAVVSRVLNLGAGATWPGEMALMIRPSLLSALIKTLRKGAVIIAGTNGKTTTSLMIKQILEMRDEKVIHNASGANLVNGIVSAFIQEASWTGTVTADWGVFEVDENSLPLVINNFKLQTSNLKLVIVLLNLFRDQLDRYGELDVIAEKWEKALKTLPKTTAVILNADDPQVAHLGRNLATKALFFGLNDPKYFTKGWEHATDSTFCLNCGGRLTYQGIYYSHLGIWQCARCGQKRPTPLVTQWPSPLPGLYNQYNALAAASVARTLDIPDKVIKKALDSFSPAFGRQEEFVVDGRRVKLFLSKNPAGFNASLRTVLELGAKYLLLVLNDRIPDGRDVSWIWDVDFEMLANHHELFISGDRCYDLALRLKYADLRVLSSRIFTNLQHAIKAAIKELKNGETLYVLPTYSAMLEVRKILTGRKIL